MIKKSLFKGLTVSLLLVFIYFALVGFVSSWQFAKNQFFQFWYFILMLALGFGVQVGLYSYLRSIVKSVSLGVVATTGVTSTVAMTSCCVHYLVNLLPILGTVGIVTIISQYQVKLFWVGLAFNFMGILYILNKVIRYTRKI